MAKLIMFGMLLFAAVGCSSCDTCGCDSEGHNHDKKECCGKDGKCCKK